MMYIVNVRKVMFGAFDLKRFETLDEAQEYIKGLYAAGHREVHLSQEIPMKVTVSVEF
ncbi:hypothetical protein [Metabacillus bambusae]|uniref:Uncharacterized protein n=1 Tax=Metabacillus bambusae TaxID=2795218 RepID=A0ABS3N4R4_9BACI|nr:hypothetical protein [Metabacillus bambusae]MBO1513237.1 hypothetical protein [Metabacillus bambusae]